MQKTEKLQLNKPDKIDSFSINHFNENSDILDKELGELPERVGDIERVLEGGVGDYTAPTIANAPAITAIPDTSSIPVSAADKTLNRVTFGNFKAILKAVYDLVYAPKSHSSTTGNYGIGTGSQYGHVKTIDNIDSDSYIPGEALSAYQGGVLQRKINDIDGRLDDGVVVAEIEAAPLDDSLNSEDLIPKVSGGILKKMTWQTIDEHFMQFIGEMGGDLRSLKDNVGSLRLWQSASKNVVSSGDDNLEFYGIDEGGKLSAINNHSDYMILATAAASGENLIQVYDSAGYRYAKNFMIDLGTALNTSSVLGTDIIYNKAKQNFLLNLVGSGSGRIILREMTLEGLLTETGYDISGSTYPQYPPLCDCNQDGVFWRRAGSGSGVNALFTDTGVKSFNNGGIASPVHDEENSRLLSIGHKAASTNFFVVITSANIGNSGSSIVTTSKNISDTSGVAISVKGDTAKIKGQQNFAFVGIYNTSENCILMYDGVSSINVIRIPGVFITKLAANSTSWISLCTDLYNSNVPNSSIAVWNNDPNMSNSPTIVDLTNILNGRKITDLKEDNGIFWICGSGGLLIQSSDNGITWTEIEHDIIDDFGKMAFAPNTIYILTYDKIHVFESYSVEAALGKRYNIGSEKITITGVAVQSGGTALLSLQSALTQNHSVSDLIKRTNHSTIPANTNQLVCVDLLNQYKHNEVTAIPIFTSLDGTIVSAEVSQRDSLTETEMYQPMNLEYEIDLPGGWKKQYYSFKFDSQKQYFAVAFEVTNNQNKPIDLYELTGSVSDKKV